MNKIKITNKNLMLYNVNESNLLTKIKNFFVSKKTRINPSDIVNDENLTYAEKLRMIMQNTDGFEFIKDFKYRYHLKQLRPKDLRDRCEMESTDADDIIEVNPDFYHDYIKNRRYSGMFVCKSDPKAVMQHFIAKKGILEEYDFCDPWEEEETDVYDGLIDNDMVGAYYIYYPDTSKMTYLRQEVIIINELNEILINPEMDFCFGYKLPSTVPNKYRKDFPNVRNISEYIPRNQGVLIDKNVKGGGFGNIIWYCTGGPDKGRDIATFVHIVQVDSNLKYDDTDDLVGEAIDLVLHPSNHYFDSYGDGLKWLPYNQIKLGMPHKKVLDTFLKKRK